MSIINPSIFQGEQSFGTTPGAPLSTDANNQVISGITNQEISSVTSQNAGTGADALMTGMTVTPVSGTYLVIFSTDLNSGSAGAVASASFYVGGTQNGVSQRKVQPFAGGTLTSGSQRIMLGLNAILTVNGSQAIEVRWSASAGTITSANRTMDIVRLA